MGRSQDGAAGAAAAMGLPVPPRPGRPGELHCGRPARGKPGKGSCLSGEPAWGVKRRAGQGGRTCGTGLRRRRRTRPGTDAARQGAVAAAGRAGEPAWGDGRRHYKQRPAPLRLGRRASGLDRRESSPERAVAGPAIRRGRRAVGQRRAAGTKSSGRGGAIGYISALPRRQAGGGRGGRPAGRLAG